MLRLMLNFMKLWSFNPKETPHVFFYFFWKRPRFRSSEAWVAWYGLQKVSWKACVRFQVCQPERHCKCCVMLWSFVDQLALYSNTMVWCYHSFTCFCFFRLVQPMQIIKEHHFFDLPTDPALKKIQPKKMALLHSPHPFNPIQNILRFALLIENDLILAPDFLWYFRLAGSLLDRDASLWCISSWNDNGFKDIVSDERKLFRTDYFPGLGWMIRS